MARASGGVFRRTMRHRRCGGKAAMVTGETPVPLFVPPDMLVRPTTRPRQPPPPDVPSTALVVGVAVVDHSGRVRDRLVLAALGWDPGDHTWVSVAAQTLVLRRVDAGGVPIDTRGRVFLPGAARAAMRFSTDERVLLVAVPARALLIVHPMRVLTALLADFYGTAADLFDDGS